MDQDTKLCYVITPYGKRNIGGNVVVDFEEVYLNIVKKGVDSLADDHRIAIMRSKDENKPGFITAEFIRNILNAEIAIIDVSSGDSRGNANVFYELGLRHAFQRRISVIIGIEEVLTNLPFDIHAMRVIGYNAATPEGQADAARNIAKCLRNALCSNDTDSPVYEFVTGYRVSVPLVRKCTARFERHFLVKDCPGTQIGVKAGDLSEIQGVDVWVNSENTDMEMGRMCDQSVSGLIRYHGAIREGQRVKKDLIQGYLRKQLGSDRSKNPTEVVVTDPGRLRSRGVKKLLHVAAFQGIHGTGYTLVPDVGECVKNALEELQELNSRRKERWVLTKFLGAESPVLRSVLFPIVGVRTTLDPYKVLSELVTAACNYVKKHPETLANRIYFQAYSEEEWRLCKDVMERHDELKEETFEDLLKEMTLDPRCARTKPTRGAGSTGDLVRSVTELMSASNELRRNGKLEEAVKLLEAGVVKGWAAFSAGNRDVESASVVADCFGMLGGNLIKQERMSRALAVYRVGRNIEMGVAGVTMTYNTVNLLVTGLLDSGWDSLRDSERDIEEVIARLDTRVRGDERNNVWAWADLGMCEFLRHNLGAAETAYKEAVKRASVDNRTSMRDKLSKIRERWPQDDAERMAFYETIQDILA